MNVLTIEPVDPPITDTEFMVCHEWAPGVPGQTINVSCEFAPDASGSVSVPYVCPGAAPFKVCHWITPPDGAQQVTIMADGGNAIPLKRNFV